MTSSASALFADQFGIDMGQTTTGERTRAYVNAFFDQHLRGVPQPLLAQPSPQYPEVAFCH